MSAKLDFVKIVTRRHGEVFATGGRKPRAVPALRDGNSLNSRADEAMYVALIRKLPR
jgi:hypothetical protein